MADGQRRQWIGTDRFGNQQLRKGLVSKVDGKQPPKKIHGWSRAYVEIRGQLYKVEVGPGNPRKDSKGRWERVGWLYVTKVEERQQENF